MGNRKNEYGKYLYAIIPYDGEKRFGHIGIDDEEVYTIAYQDIACVVQDTSVEEYELSEGNVRRHDEVLRHLLGSYAVLPAEFGTVFQNARILAQLVRKAYVLLKESLELVDNSVELGVKVIRRRDPEDIEAEQGKPNSVEILENLRKNAVKSASGDLFSDRLILNESFLVKKEAVGSFSEDVARFGSNYPTLRILYSGPWAPYNFVYVKVGKEGIELRKKR